MSDALKDGSIDKVSKGIEQLVIMMINAIGMIEQKVSEFEFEKRLEVLEDDMDLIKSFLLSKPIPLPGSTIPPQGPPLPSKAPPRDDTPISPIQTSSTQVPPQTPIQETQLPQTGPTEENILAFRQQILKPTPQHEKPKPQPVSIRAALMQEMKEYFGSALTKIKKENKETKSSD